MTHEQAKELLSQALTALHEIEPSDAREERLIEEADAEIHQAVAMLDQPERHATVRQGVAALDRFRLRNPRLIYMVNELNRLLDDLGI